MKGHIRKRGKTWTIVLPVGRHPTTGKWTYKWFGGFRTKRLAESGLPDLLREAQTGSLLNAAPASMTVGDFLRRWMRDYAATRVRARTMVGYLTIVEGQLIPSLGQVPLRELQPYHIQAYYARVLKDGHRRRPGGLKAKTVVQHHRILSQALGHALKWGLIARNAAKLVSPPRVERAPKLDVLDGAQVAALVKEARGTRYYPMIHLLVYTGMRRSELLGLQWRDVDLAGRRLSVQRGLVYLRRKGFVLSEPKTPKARRIIALPEAVVIMLKRHFENCETQARVLGRGLGREDFVFSNPDGAPIYPDTVTDAVIRIAEKAGLPATSPHDLRHSHATLMLSENVHLKVVSERLGHSNVGTTADLYSHVLPHIQQEAADKIQAAIPLDANELQMD